MSNCSSFYFCFEVALLSILVMASLSSFYACCKVALEFISLMAKFDSFDSNVLTCDGQRCLDRGNGQLWLVLFHYYCFSPYFFDCQLLIIKSK